MFLRESCLIPLLFWDSFIIETLCKTFVLYASFLFVGFTYRIPVPYRKVNLCFVIPDCLFLHISGLLLNQIVVMVLKNLDQVFLCICHGSSWCLFFPWNRLVWYFYTVILHLLLIITQYWSNLLYFCGFTYFLFHI